MKTLKEVVNATEGRYLRYLMSCNYSHTVAAKLAGVTRVQLFRLLKKHGIDRNPHATQRLG